MRLPFPLPRYFSSRARRGLVVYQLVLILLVIIILIFVLLYVARRNQVGAPAAADSTATTGQIHHPAPYAGGRLLET